MRLLPKSEVAKGKALDRQKEIDEGKKLATKVDDLRELASVEEANLTKFRDKTVQALRENITTLVKEKDELESDIKNMKDEREALLIPLDSEWEKVLSLKEELSNKQLALVEREFNLEQEGVSLTRSLKELELDKERLEDKKLSLQELIKENVILHEEAVTTLNEAHTKKADIESILDRKASELDSKDTSLTNRETDIQNILKNIQTREQKLTDGERVLQDRYNTLERTIKRLKK